MIHIGKLLRELVRREKLDSVTAVICGQNDSENGIAVFDGLNQ
jgi:hypothetical protein